ncbi:hypothetical protein BH11BAC2_BH11BAC2_18260 [soil metagenome]
MQLLKKNPAFLFLILIQLGFIIAALNLGHSTTKDSTEYLLQADNLRSSGSWYCGDLNQEFDPALLSQRPPLYGLFLAFTEFPFSGILLVLIVQSLLSFLNCVLAWNIFKRISGKEMKATVFFLPLIFFSSQFIYANMLMSEILFQSAWMIAAYFLIRFIYAHQIADLWKHQFSICVAMLIKPVAFIFPIVSIPFIFYLIKKEKLPSEILITFIAPLLVIFGMIAYNFQHTGVAEYSSIQRKLMINYNIPALLNLKQDQSITQTEIDSIQSIAATLNYPERARFIDQQCFLWIKKQTVQYIGLHFKGIISFFLDHGRWDLYQFFTGKTDEFNAVNLRSVYTKDGMSGALHYIMGFSSLLVLYLALTILMNFILLICFIRFIFLHSVPKHIRIGISIMVIYIALLTGPSASARFRTAVYPLLLITWGICLVEKKKVLNFPIK